MATGIRLTEARTTDKALAEWLRNYAHEHRISQSKVIIMALERMKAEESK